MAWINKSGTAEGYSLSSLIIGMMGFFVAQILKITR